MNTAPRADILPRALLDIAETIHVPAKEHLLEAGHKARAIYFVAQGCVRLYFLSDGRDITFQFFTEGSCVASFDSLYTSTPSQFSLQAIEPCTILAIPRDDFFSAIRQTPSLRDIYEQQLVERFHFYQNRFLSHICHTPRQRWMELQKERPELLNRIPQHYLASYLGITPVSLSRLRNSRK